MSTHYILRFDDVAPNMRWDHFRRVEDACRRCGVRPLLGVIPDNRDPDLLAMPAFPGDFWAEMRRLQELGWDIAQHGYQHRYVNGSPGILGLSPHSEFAELPLHEQKEKLLAGRDVLQRQGIVTSAFMAPSHSFDENTLAALAETGFHEVTDGLALFPYYDAGLLFVPQLSAIPRRLPWGVYTFCLHLNLMNDAQVDRLVGFIDRCRAQMIAFREAARFATVWRLNRPLGLWAHVALQAGRSLRRRD